MKRKTTKEYLAESFLELAENKPVKKIKITDITSNCGFSKPTFYIHFNDKYDLITFIVRQNVTNIISQEWCRNGISFEDKLRELIGAFLECAINNKRSVENIVRQAMEDSTFFKRLTEEYINIISELIEAKKGVDSLPEDIMLLLRSYIYGITILFGKWIFDGMSYSKELIGAIIAEALPLKLRTVISGIEF